MVTQPLLVHGHLWDDEKEYRNQFAEFLKRKGGIAVKATGDCSRVVRNMRSPGGNSDLAILDVVQDEPYSAVGLDAVRKIRETNRDCFIVLMTARTHDLEKQYHKRVVNLGREAGADLVFDKGDIGPLETNPKFLQQFWTRFVAKRLSRAIAQNPALNPYSALYGALQFIEPQSRYVDKVEVLKMLSNGAGQVPQPATVSPSDPNYTNLLAFERERQELLDRHVGRYAAYHDGRRITIDRDAETAYTKARKKVGLGVILVEEIRPVVQDRSYHIRAPFRRRA
jgi:CheY-like chemotaxis protein